MEAATRQPTELLMLIDGERRVAAAGRTLVSREPASGEPWATFPEAAAEDVDLAVAAARRAFEGEWSAQTASERGLVLLRIADALEERCEDLARLESRDGGKLLREARAQAAALPRWFRFYGGLADKIDGRVPAFDFPTVLNYVEREPLGVIAALVPWNSVLMLSTCKLAPALACGNTVVIKPSELAPAPLLELVATMEAAGLPPGVVNVLTGGAECGEALVAHPGVDRVSFTGGPATARSIAATVAPRLVPTSFELGGKSANVVFADADLEAAVAGVLAGIFGAAGQTCVAGSRALVQRSAMEPFLEALLARVEGIRVGPPEDPETEVGPISTSAHLERIEAAVQRAVAEGAVLAAGGHPVSVEGHEGGSYYQPTVLTGVRPEMAVAREEIFGPVLALLGFDDEAEAACLANATDFALAAGVWTRDVKRAHRVARDLRAGTVWINTYRTLSPLSPHGGPGLSGHGRENGLEVIAELTQPKSVWVELSERARDPFTVRLR